MGYSVAHERGVMSVTCVGAVCESARRERVGSRIAMICCECITKVEEMDIW